jgi:hypothetical protein
MTRQMCAAIALVIASTTIAAAQPRVTCDDRNGCFVEAEDLRAGGTIDRSEAIEQLPPVKLVATADKSASEPTLVITRLDTGWQLARGGASITVVIVERAGGHDEPVTSSFTAKCTSCERTSAPRPAPRPDVDNACGWHLGLQVIDLGQFVATGPRGELQEPTWSTFIAPGVEAGRDFRLSKPSSALFNVSVHATYAPALLEKTDDLGEVTAGAWRVGISLGYYVPFFDLT